MEPTTGLEPVTYALRKRSPEFDQVVEMIQKLFLEVLEKAQKQGENPSPKGESFSKGRIRQVSACYANATQLPALKKPKGESS